MTAAPSTVTIRMYNVGFGDCFGLAFHYENEADRHVVIDCGTMALPQSKGKARYSMKDVADDIKQWCGGSLDAVIATHRHQDHISGFGGSAGKVFREMQPTLVIQPWTEDPDLPVDATKPITSEAVPIGKAALATSLAGQQSFLGYALSTLGSTETLPAELDYLGRNNISNRKAVENLLSMGANGKSEYLSHGQQTALEDALPGVKVHVLGPPTVEEWQPVTRQRHEDDVEFWHLLGSNMPTAEGPGRPAPVFDHGSFTKKIPPEARWLARHMDALQAEMLLPIVRALDDELNNTSLILMFEVGEGDGRKLLLFPGDAQIENWEYVFRGPRAEEWKLLLAETDVYKVGHHGSLNGTPKASLWPLFEKRNPTASSDRMLSLLSTRGRVHGSHHRETEVPRTKLVRQLDSHTDLISTQRQQKKARDITVTIG